MSSPASCNSPSSPSSYCSSIFSYNGSGYPQSPGDMSNITTPDSSTPKESFARSPLFYSAPSPNYSASESTATLPLDIMSPSDSFYSPSYLATLNSPIASPPHNPSPYPQEYYREPLPSLPPIDTTNVYPSHFISHQRSQSAYTVCSRSSSPPVSTSPYSRHRRSLPPVDPKKYEEEEWITPSGKKVRHSAMHLYCATM